MENQPDIGGGGILGQGLRYRFRVQGLGHAGFHKNRSSTTARCRTPGRHFVQLKTMMSTNAKGRFRVYVEFKVHPSTCSAELLVCLLGGSG